MEFKALIVKVMNLLTKYNLRGGKLGSQQEIASPWDVTIAENKESLYIAMAGIHQVWNQITPNSLVLDMDVRS